MNHFDGFEKKLEIVEGEDERVKEGKEGDVLELDVLLLLLLILELLVTGTMRLGFWLILLPVGVY